MIGNYFYNETIRKTVIAFGTLFNNITIKKYASDGKSISQIKVPIAYGPIQRFLARIEQQSNFDDNVAISLPRLSFELSSYTYDASRKASPIQKFTMKSPSQKTKIKKMFLPVPYDVGFFQPAYSVTVNMLEGVEEKRDIPFTLTNVSFTDEYEGDFSTRRFIQYDLDFVAKTYFYQEVPTDENGIIKKVQIDYATAIRAPREQRYTVVPQAAKDYNDDGTGSLAATLTTKQTLVKVTSGSSFAVGGFIQINSEVMKIKEISGNDLIVNRGQFGTSIDSHASGDSIDLVNKSDSDLIDYGDTFGFTETRSFFDADGLEFSTVTGTDEL